MSSSDGQKPRNISDTGKEHSSPVTSAKAPGETPSRQVKGIISRYLLKYTYIFDIIAAGAMMATVVMLLLSFSAYLARVVNAGGHWHHYESPAHVFTGWSIASTSEHCDEYARQLVMEGHPTDEVTLMMMICLHHFEPQASSVMGSSSLLYASVDSHGLVKCWQSTANHEVAMDMKRFMRDLLLSEYADFAGPVTTAYPMNIRSFVALSQDMGADWEAKWSRVRRKVEIEWDHLQIPASKRLVDALSNRIVELQMFARGRHSTFVANVKHEGDSFENPLDIEFLLKFTNASMRGFTPEDEADLSGRMTELLMEMDKEEKKTFVSEWAARLEDSKVVAHKVAVDLVNESSYLVCAPKLYNKETGHTMQPLTMTGLKIMQQMDAKKKLAGPTGTDYLYQDEEHYLRVAKAMEQVYKLTSAFGRENWKRWSKSMQEDYKKLALWRLNNSHKANDEIPLYGNSFVIVNHKNNDAVAYGATLGTNFGSITSHKDLVFMNNLLSYTSRHFVTIGDVYYYYEPIMIFRELGANQYKHHITYIDLSKSRAPSVSTARKISSIFLNLSYKMKLRDVLSWALYYVDVDNINRISREIPWRRYLKILKLNSAEDKEKGVLDEKDYVMAVEETETINFVADSVSPNWRPPMGV